MFVDSEIPKVFVLMQKHPQIVGVFVLTDFHKAVTLTPSWLRNMEPFIMSNREIMILSPMDHEPAYMFQTMQLPQVLFLPIFF